MAGRRPAKSTASNKESVLDERRGALLEGYEGHHHAALALAAV
jgi:hypothetical protein